MDGPVVVDTSGSPHARLKPVPVSAVKLADGFWLPRMIRNHAETIPGQHRMNEETGRLDNLRIASGRKQGEFKGLFFNDSDVHKWVEAAAWDAAGGEKPHPEMDAVIAEIAAAQQADGYLNSYYMFGRAKERWSNLKDMHELYCAGHMIQGAVAHHRATGSDAFLSVARRKADLIDGTFGPGKRDGVPGHEEIEMALVELYRETRERRYLDLARYFLDARGRGIVGGGAYHQDHRPVREQDEVVGHAVRAMYLYCGMTDVYLETGDGSLRAALEKLWLNMTTRRLYVTGGVGARYEGEALGRDYELPNERAYAETCAQIGGVMWSWRMAQMEGDAKYTDIMELTLYNGVLPGLSLDGRTYFYQNPLEDDGTHRRQPWFHCVCCPPNIARLLASLPGYFYSVSEEGIWVHLYARGEARITLPGGREISVRQETDYPWDRNVRIEVDGGGAEFTVFIRVPAWCAGEAVISTPPDAEVGSGSYTAVRRKWRKGDAIQMTLPMPVQRVECHPYVEENRGRVALQRGPLLYCVEGCDHPGLDIRDLVLPAESKVTADPRRDPSGVAVTLRAEALVVPPGAGWSGRLYRAANGASEPAPPRKARMVAVPYYSWANREPGRMRVWLRSR